MVSNSNDVTNLTSIAGVSQVQNRLNVTDEIFKLLQWLNKDFTPSAMYEIRSFNELELNELVLNWGMVESKCKDLGKFVKLCRARAQQRRRNVDSFGSEFLNSGGFDERMADFISKQSKTCLEESRVVAVPDEELDVESLSSSSDCEEDEDSAVNGHEDAGELGVVNNTEQECCKMSKEYSNFQFDFKVWYHKDVEMLVYYRPKWSYRPSPDNLHIPVIQFSGFQVFKCLICNCEGNIHKSTRCVFEHVNGQKHLAKQQNPKTIDNIIAYHKAWVNQERNYQAHQVYFFPAFYPNTNDYLICVLCCQDLPFSALTDHINSKLHKKEVLKVIARERSPLTSIQELVYLSPDEAKEREAAIASPKPAATKKPARPPKKHHVVWSIVDPKGATIKEVLEQRFWPHLDLLLEDGDQVQCTCSTVKIDNTLEAKVAHIHSAAHLLKVKHAVGLQEFYCELCALSLRADIDWFHHLASSKHTKRCTSLSEERRSSIREYFCQTCNLVIYGDNLSVKRHQELTKRVANKELALSVNVIKLFNSGEHLEQYAKQLVDEANAMLLNSEPVNHCIAALERALRTTYPTCTAYPFGSRVSGLGNENSDLDVFVDMGDMYLGDGNQDRHSQEKYVYGACKVFRKLKKEFGDINPIPTARTPIVQVLHLPTKIDCDLSFKHGLSVENTKFLKLCIKLQPIAQSAILILKQWLKHCELNDYITTYAIAMMVIFYLEIQNLLLPIAKLKNLSSATMLFVNGWSILDFTDVAEEVQTHLKPYSGNLQSFLIDFFNYYKDFKYESDIICPLLGFPLEKRLFAGKLDETLPIELMEYVENCSNATSEQLKTKTALCIQDPFDLSHNLTKACTHGRVEKLKAYCDLSSSYLNRSS